MLVLLFRVLNCELYLPDTFQMHRSYLDDMPDFFTLQDPITPSTGHARNIEQFRAVYHMII